MLRLQRPSHLGRALRTGFRSRLAGRSTPTALEAVGDPSAKRRGGGWLAHEVAQASHVEARGAVRRSAVMATRWIFLPTDEQAH